MWFHELALVFNGCNRRALAVCVSTESVDVNEYSILTVFRRGSLINILRPKDS